MKFGIRHINEVQNVIEDARMRTKKYFNEAVVFEKQIADLKREYLPAIAEQKIKNAEHLRPDRQEVIEHLKNQLDSVNEMFDILENESLNPKRLTEDWKLLELPVILSDNQIQNLRDKHADNLLFCQALEQYCQKHKIYADTRCYLPERRNLINNNLNALIKALSQNRRQDFQALDELGYYDRLLEQIENISLPEPPPESVEDEDDDDVKKDRKK